MVTSRVAKTHSAEHAPSSPPQRGLPWCDEPQNREPLAELLSDARYLTSPRASSPRPAGSFRRGHGRVKTPQFPRVRPRRRQRPHRDQGRRAPGRLAAAACLPRTLSPDLPAAFSAKTSNRSALSLHPHTIAIQPIDRAGSPSPTTDVASLNRRSSLHPQRRLTGAAALFSALGTRPGPPPLAPPRCTRTPNLNFGIIALTDVPHRIAHERVFQKIRHQCTITKGCQLAAIRDNLSSGSIQATHMLLGMRSPRPWASPFPQKSDGHPMAAQPQRPGHHAEIRVEGQSGADPKALKALRRSGHQTR